MLSWVKFICPCLRFIVVRNGPGVVFWHPFSLSVSVTCFSKILHFGYLTIRRKTPGDSRWFRQARKLPLTACCGMAKSARCCPPRPSRRFAKRAMEQWVLHTQGTIAFCLHTLRKTVLFLFFLLLVLLFFPRGSLLDVSRLLGLTLRLSAPVCVATGTP